MTTRSLSLALAALAAGAVAPPPSAAQSVARIGDLVVHEGDVPRRLVGYGLVVGLDGTGDRSFGPVSGGAPTVRSVVNLLRRFNIEVPAERLRLRNVAAVLVTAETSPYLRAGGRFEVQVAALGDATSLRGGVLWITPLVPDPDAPPVATAQGPVYVPPDETFRYGGYARRGNSGRIPDGGLMEVAPPTQTAAPARLLLRHPDLGTAERIAAAVNAALGDSTARVEDPGSVRLTFTGASADHPLSLSAALDTLPVTLAPVSRVVIDARVGSVVAGGDIRVGPATVSHRGITLEIGGTPSTGTPATGLLRLEPQVAVQDIAAGLHAVGARPEEIAAIFEALRAAGALGAELVIR